MGVALGYEFLGSSLWVWTMCLGYSLSGKRSERSDLLMFELRSFEPAKYNEY